MSSRDVYLVGSVPLDNAAEVFETVSAILGNSLKRLPDGETGERSDWITWLEPIFSKSQWFEPAETFQVHEHAPLRQRYRLKQGVHPEDVQFNDLFYADTALQSYAVFRSLRDEGKIPATTRLQVDLVPAHSVLWLYIVEEEQDQIDPIYNKALMTEIDKIAGSIPSQDLAIQFDIASAVFARLERKEISPYGRDNEETAARFATIIASLANYVPADIELLFHFCYGDSNHRHVVEPSDMGNMVDMANRLTRAITRPIQLIHMPVPRSRFDNAYFEPLRWLDLRPETQLSFGLVHYTDGLDGARRRLATACRYRKDFAIATECGFGRRPPETIRDLLMLHQEVARME